MRTSDCDSSLPNFDPSTMICVGPAKYYGTASILGSCRFENRASLVQGKPSVAIGIKSIVEQTCGITGKIFTAPIPEFLLSLIGFR